ncbi:hypothetical protein F511_12198 [Dorcoceras hygrometricum]|uniref:Uncharacterized protein n=1 Tax=Dorcoceras hygrometricum TaxID=472368 RepID=A0A2Z7BUF5_9LAMI|nr:hypothetical protein F511_12198 [Dorcoceras hygrometricum]
MPGIAQRINNVTEDSIDSDYQNPLVGNGMVPFHSCNGSSGSNDGFWLMHRDDVSYNQLQKFWCELTLQARQKLMRIDKQTLFEHARKKMYCSRCNGMLLEGFLQIVMYGKSLQQVASGRQCCVKVTDNQDDDDLCIANGCHDDSLDPSVHPWGGLTTTKDGTLTLLNCYLCSKSFKGLQNVFDSARARERERELLYPDACGGSGRGWISQGVAGYGRVHGIRETCALHTARLSVETLADFWTALGEETQQSLLRMKEDDFVERLMYRFYRKRFCRDCRRNVIREFKELKELKRMRMEPRCTSWFCAADTAFQYEVSFDTVQADWHQTFLDSFGAFHHFEWAIGTGEGKSDILEFENVGLSGKVQVTGLDLSGLNACYITLRAWKKDGRCNEICVKAHALRGQQCVHCRLVVGDGFVTMKRGESIRRFFEHAEEAEEEEDDDSDDKDGNELDSDCSRPQKHAKSPELAREFLLDAATVIFKEQASFREGTARQNAHGIFVCLALKLLEERVHVACKEIITLEKQMKLLEEEEMEKREEEERKERRKIKEKEKKLRRKERLRNKEKWENKCGTESSIDSQAPDILEDSALCVDEEGDTVCSSDLVCETPVSPLSPDIQDNLLFTDYMYSNMVNHSGNSVTEEEFGKRRDWNPCLLTDRVKYTRRKLRFRKDPQPELGSKWSDRKKGSPVSESTAIMSGFASRNHADDFDSARSIDCFSRPESHCIKVTQAPKYGIKSVSPSDLSKPYHRSIKYPQQESVPEINGRHKSKFNARQPYPPNIKKVWEPLDSRKKSIQGNSDSDVTLRSTPKIEAPESSGASGSDEVIFVSVQNDHVDNDVRGSTGSTAENCRETEKVFHVIGKPLQYSKEAVAEDTKPRSMTGSPRGTPESSVISSSNSDNYSCLSEGDSNTSSINSQNPETLSISDAKEASQNADGRETSSCFRNEFTGSHNVVDQCTERGRQDIQIPGPDSTRAISLGNFPSEATTYNDNRRLNASLGAVHPPNVLQHYAFFHAPPVNCYHPSSLNWPAGSTNGLMSLPHTNHYLFPNSFGYGLNGNAGLMQYGTLQHPPPPLLNPSHIPFFQPVAQVKVVSPKAHAKVCNLSGQRELQQNIEKMAETDPNPAKPPMVVDAIQNEKSNKVDMEDNQGFSLFHFGGPVGLSTGFNVDTASIREGIAWNSSAKCPDGDQFYNKKDVIEEYNLFAASNGIKFSLS